MTDEHRGKIQNSSILNALIEHSVGKRKMSATQVSAGLGLLRKVLPDLQAVTHSGDEDNPIRHKHELDAERFTRAIASIATRSGDEGGTGQPAGGDEG